MSAFPSFEQPTFSLEEPTIAGSHQGSVATAGSTDSSGVRRSLQERRAQALLGSQSSSQFSRNTSLSLDFGSIVADPSCSNHEKPEPVDVIHRGWWETPDGRNLPADFKNPPQAIKVVSYNILAQRYVTSEKYPISAECPMHCLTEEYRLKRVVAEIKMIDPDIIVFAELSIEACQKISQDLRSMGYSKFHVPISVAEQKKARDGSNIMDLHWRSGAETGRVDLEGVGIFWRSSRFSSDETIPIGFNVLTQKDKLLAAALKARICSTSHNVAAFVVLKSNTNPDEKVLVAGIHAAYDSGKPDAQLYQMVRLLSSIESVAEVFQNVGPVSVIVAGDFNANWCGPSVQYALNGRVSSWPFTDCLPAGDSGNARHNLGLRGAYQEYSESHPTHVTSHGTMIDHIFFDTGSLICTSVMRIEDSSKPHGPTKQIPSDHFPIAAVLVPKSAFT